MHLPHHLTQIGSIWYYRQAVPADLQAAFGLRYLKHSLRTHDPLLAKTMAYSLGASYLEKFQAIRMKKKTKAELAREFAELGDLQVRQQTPPYLHYVSNTPTPAIKLAIDHDMALLDAIEWYLKKAEETLPPDNHKRHARFLMELVEFRGNGALHTITRPILDGYREYLTQEKNNSIPTLRNKFSVVSLFFDALISAGHYHLGNPAKGQIVYTAKQKAKRRKDFGRQAFTSDEIAKIFEPSNYLAHCTTPSEYWVPLIQLYTGARVNEVCQLKVADFFEVEGIKCLAILDEDFQSVKTESSQRLLPVHYDLLRLGLWSYIQKVERMGYKQLFPHLVKSSNRFAGMQRTAFAAYLTAIKLKDNSNKGKLGTHSFRNNVVHKLQDHDVNGDYRRAYVGHSSIDAMSIVDVHSLVYQRKATMKELTKNVLPALEFGLPIDDLHREASYWDRYLSTDWVSKQHQHAENRRKGQRGEE